MKWPWRKWFWRSYAWLLASAGAASFLLIANSNSVTLAVLDAVATCICLGGLFAYVYRRRLLATWFWRIWLPGVVLWDLLYNLGLLHRLIGVRVDEGPRADWRLGIIVLIVGIPVVLPAYVALYRYGRGRWLQTS